jgi:DNA-binding NarL/FixJ family response regulator
MLSELISTRQSSSLATSHISEPTAAATSILLVAPHALVRAGLRAILSANPGLRVVGESSDVAAAAALAPGLGPDVILLTRRDDIEGAEQLRSAHPGACILYLDEREVTESADVHCVPSDADVAALCSMLGIALGGRCGGCAFRSRCATRAATSRTPGSLSPRERQVAVYVAEGMSSKQIAGALGISLRTVNTYRESLAKKIGASSGAVVTRFVLENQLAARDEAPRSGS